MFGSGKTALGNNFIKQLGEEETQRIIQEKLPGDDWKKELALAQKAESIRHDLSTCQTLRGIARKLAFEEFKDRSPETEDLARYIFKQAVERLAPQFIHFDEIGDLGENVTQLRNVVQNVWNLMLTHPGEPHEMPRIYFYLSGKAVPLTALGTGAASPIGAKWIILDLLKEDHIWHIVEKVTSAPSLLSPDVKTLHGLKEALQQWTGGSPRLLVYSLRVLHHLVKEGKQFANAEEAMEEVYKVLKRVMRVAADVFLAKNNEDEWRPAWLYLILLAQLRVPCTRATELPVGSTEYSLEVLLGRLNVYISKPETAIDGMPDSDPFYISHMKMVEQFVREHYSADCRDLLENMAVHSIVVQACLQPDQAHTTWGTLMRPLLQGSKAEQLPVGLHRANPLKSFPKVTSSAKQLSTLGFPLPKQIHPDNLAAAMKLLEAGHLYRPATMSRSADLFVKQQDLIIEVQDKSGVSIGVSFRDVRDEVGKCIPEGQVVWLLVALQLNDSLDRWVGQKEPLVLGSGTYEEEDGGGLLYRSLSQQKWQKRLENGAWRDITKATGKGTELRVREGLQLAIPRPEHLKGFLGEEDFDIVMELARKSHDRTVKTVEIPFLSRFYNFQRPVQGTGAPTASVWVIRLQKDDGTFDEIGAAFQVKGDLKNVDDLKEAIKTKKPKRVSCDADEIVVYRKNEDTEWVEEEPDAEIKSGASKTDCYGFTLPSA